MRYSHTSLSHTLLSYPHSHTPPPTSIASRRRSRASRAFCAIYFDIVSHPGGQFSSNALAVVNIRNGHHIVLLKIKHDSGEVDQHAMALTERGGEMHLVDNRRLKPVAMLSDDDRVDQWKARGVFYSLLRDAAVDTWGQAETFTVTVRSVWSVVPRSKRGAESQREEPAGKRQK